MTRPSLKPLVWVPIYWLGAGLPTALFLTERLGGAFGLFWPLLLVGPVISVAAATAGAGSIARRVVRIVVLPIAIYGLFDVAATVATWGARDARQIQDAGIHP